MAEELPSDVRAVLTQLLEAAETAVQDGEYGTARRILETVGTVSSNKLPDRQRREQFRHGCTRVREALDPVAEPELASEYLRAMARRLCSSSV